MNELTKLVNKEKPAMNFKIEFYAIGGNAFTLPSGIYFYKLKAGSPSTSSGQGFFETKKNVDDQMMTSFDLKSRYYRGSSCVKAFADKCR
jgi:hypothetical protein